MIIALFLIVVFVVCLVVLMFNCYWELTEIREILEDWRKK
jgi:hypothetical protein